jgi:hypothetical protein
MGESKPGYGTRIRTLILYLPGVANPFRNEYAEISFLAQGYSNNAGVSSDRRCLYHGRYPLAEVIPTPGGPILPKVLASRYPATCLCPFPSKFKL